MTNPNQNPQRDSANRFRRRAWGGDQIQVRHEPGIDRSGEGLDLIQDALLILGQCHRSPFRALTAAAWSNHLVIAPILMPRSKRQVNITTGARPPTRHRRLVKVTFVRQRRFLVGAAANSCQPCGAIRAAFS